MHSTPSRSPSSPVDPRLPTANIAAPSSVVINVSNTEGTLPASQLAAPLSSEMVSSESAVHLVIALLLNRTQLTQDLAMSNALPLTERAQQRPLVLSALLINTQLFALRMTMSDILVLKAEKAAVGTLNMVQKRRQNRLMSKFYQQLQQFIAEVMTYQRRQAAPLPNQSPEPQLLEAQLNDNLIRAQIHHDEAKQANEVHERQTGIDHAAQLSGIQSMLMSRGSQYTFTRALPLLPEHIIETAIENAISNQSSSSVVSQLSGTHTATAASSSQGALTAAERFYLRRAPIESALWQQLTQNAQLDSATFNQLFTDFICSSGNFTLHQEKQSKYDTRWANEQGSLKTAYTLMQERLLQRTFKKLSLHLVSHALRIAELSQNLSLSNREIAQREQAITEFNDFYATAYERYHAFHQAMLTQSFSIEVNRQLIRQMELLVSSISRLEKDKHLKNLLTLNITYINRLLDAMQATGQIERSALLALASAHFVGSHTQPSLASHAASKASAAPQKRTSAQPMPAGEAKKVLLDEQALQQTERDLQSLMSLPSTSTAVLPSSSDLAYQLMLQDILLACVQQQSSTLRQAYTFFQAQMQLRALSKEELSYLEGARQALELDLNELDNVKEQIRQHQQPQTSQATRTALQFAPAASDESSTFSSELHFAQDPSDEE